MPNPKIPYRQLLEKYYSFENELDFCRQLFSADEWRSISDGLDFILNSILSAGKGVSHD